MGSIGKKKVLVVDDDQAICDALQFGLEESGFAVDVITNAKALDSLSTDLPDVLLLDIWMSGYDGGEICKELKSKKETKNLPIIMMSAKRDVKEVAKESGAEDYIAKPFGIEELLKKIQKQLRRSVVR